MIIIGLVLKVVIAFVGLLITLWNFGAGIILNDRKKYEIGAIGFVSTTGLLLLISTIKWML